MTAERRHALDKARPSARTSREYAQFAVAYYYPSGWKAVLYPDAQAAKTAITQRLRVTGPGRMYSHTLYARDWDRPTHSWGDWYEAKWKVEQR